MILCASSLDINSSDNLQELFPKSVLKKPPKHNQGKCLLGKLPLDQSTIICFHHRVFLFKAPQID
jgi:hypothetical protein